MLSNKKSIFLLFLAALIGGFGFIAMKLLLDSGYTPIQTIAGRYIVAVFSLVIIYFKELKNITKKELEGGLKMGFLLFLLFVLLAEGLKRTTPSINAFLSCSTSIVVPFILWVKTKTKPDKFVLTASLITIVGVAMLSLTETLSFNLGAALSFLAAVAFAMQIVFLDEYAKDSSPVRLTLIECIVVMVLSTGCAIVMKEPMPTIKSIDLVMVFVAGFFCTSVYFLLQSIGQKNVSAASASIIITTEALFAAVASWLYYGEKLTFRILFGGALIFLAVIIVETKFSFFRKTIDEKRKMV